MLLRRIERFLQRHRMAPTRFGREAVGDPSFVFDLKDGRLPRARTVERVDAYISSNDGLVSSSNRGEGQS